LEDIGTRVDGMKSPAIIVMGEVVRFAKSAKSSLEYVVAQMKSEEE